MENSVLQKNITIWDAIYKSGGYLLKYPCEDLVVAVSRLLSGVQPKNNRLLDIGFGSGNNLEFFAGRGFQCFGVDISSCALTMVQTRLASAGLHAELKITTDNRYPFADDFFDIVIAWHVLSYNDETSLEIALSEIRRVLKKNGGVFLATFPTYKEFRIAQGKKIAHNTFEFICSNSNQNGTIVIAAENEQDVRKIFSGFSILDIGYSEITVKGMTNSHWLICGENVL